MEVKNKDPDSGDEQVDKVSMLMEKVVNLEKENKRITEEYDGQRAKMKELFLQAEAENNKEKNRLNSMLEKLQNELDETRSNLLIIDMKAKSDFEDEKRKNEEQIASLEKIIRESVAESENAKKSYDAEIRKLQASLQRLQEENQNLRTLGQQSSPHHSTQESGGLAPTMMLSAMTKSLVRKLGADTFSNQENLEESMRRAQEDAEVLRSLVVPLEEEIKALKDKLRATDEQLQRCVCGQNPLTPVKQTPADNEEVTVQNESNKTEEETISTELNPSKQNAQISDVTTPQSPPGCDMCSNYEAQLQREQQRNSELEARLLSAEKLMLKEIESRREMEEKWNEKKEIHKQEVNELNKRTLCSEQDLQELRKTFNELSAGVAEQLQQLTRKREQVLEQLNVLQCDNDRLVGKYIEHSSQMQSEEINLPDTVAELQEKLLKLQEDLITAAVGKETAQENERTLQAEINRLETRVLELETELDESKQQNQYLMSEKLKFSANKDKYKQYEKQLEEQIGKLKEELEENKKHESTIQVLQSRIQSLYQNLDISEQVQKDFVMLTQLLQRDLEKIRASDTQVRWQHEDDIDECPGCHSFFIVAGANASTAGRRTTAAGKKNCLHCGQVFCVNCLNRTVPSGPKQRPAAVCGVCHTLLVKSSAPYFSTETLHSPE